MSDAARSAYIDAPAREAFGITTYAVAPIVLEDGEIFGTLCVLDSEEVEVTEEQRAVLVALSRLIARVYDDRRRKEQLRDALYRLHQGAEERHRLVKRIATDITEPVAAITGLAALLVDHDVDAGAQSTTIEMIHAHAHRVRVLLDGLVQAESGQPGTTAEIDIEELLAELAERCAPLVGPGVDLVAEGAGALTAPRLALTRLVEALVVGAAQRTDEGTVRLAISATATAVELIVSDPGRSLTEDERDELVRTATGADVVHEIEASALADEDVRLPLVVARELAASFGAELTVTTSGETGTRVSVRLPAGAAVARS